VTVPVNVRVPAFLRDLTDPTSEVECEGSTVGAVIASLDARFPGTAARMLDDSGLRRYVNVFVNGADVRFLNGLESPVSGEDSVVILPAAAGG
jgi:molybdopterin synthase sulfur carrier subunit